MILEISNNFTDKISFVTVHRNNLKYLVPPLPAKQSITLHNIDPEEILVFHCKIFKHHQEDVYVGEFSCRVSELFYDDESIFFYYSRSKGSPVVFSNDKKTIITLFVKITEISPQLSIIRNKIKDRHALKKNSLKFMIVTRGTRGDIQPFIALSKALCNNYDISIIFVTEMNYRSIIIDANNSLENNNSQIVFRSSGGDTELKLSTVTSKWALEQTNDILQSLMLSRAEMEFFDSEPAIFYWAKFLKPKMLIYGFTMMTISCIIHESLKIPIVGFILQPTIIPSSQFDAVTNVSETSNKLSTLARSHEMINKTKAFSENITFDRSLDQIRIDRGLKPTKKTVIELLENSPIVIPIDPVAFGGVPPDWKDNIKMTNFIYLRNKNDKLNDSIMDFINQSKENHRKITLMGFSSMPVDKKKMVDIGRLIVEDCNSNVIIMGGVTRDKLSLDVQKTLEKYKNKIFFDKGAPFNLLFPFMDVLIIHGGLGTTSEALLAGKPTIVTGTLLLDQRFWGYRLSKLEVGPPPSFIDHFKSVVVQHVNKALEPTDLMNWRENAQKISEYLKENFPPEETIKINVETIMNIYKQIKQ